MIRHYGVKVVPAPDPRRRLWRLVWAGVCLEVGLRAIQAVYAFDTSAEILALQTTVLVLVTALMIALSWTEQRPTHACREACALAAGFCVTSIAWIVTTEGLGDIRARIAVVSALALGLGAVVLRLLALLFVQRTQRRAVVQTGSLCWTCGHDFAGAETGTCPGCGTPIHGRRSHDSEGAAVRLTAPEARPVVSRALLALTALVWVLSYVAGYAVVYGSSRLFTMFELDNGMARLTVIAAPLSTAYVRSTKWEDRKRLSTSQVFPLGPAMMLPDWDDRWWVYSPPGDWWDWNRDRLRSHTRSARIAHVHVPLPLMVVIFLLFAYRIASGSAWSTRRARRARGLCVECAYDLTGNVSGVCPECGTPIGRARSPDAAGITRRFDP